MNPSLKDLYHRLILDRQKDARGFAKNARAQHVVEAYNPVCGDQFKIYIDCRDHKIEHITFHGYGCAISKASTSVMVEQLTGKNMEEVLQATDQFFAAMEGHLPNPPEIYAALATAGAFPGRKQCATLSWDAVKHFMEKL